MESLTRKTVIPKKSLCWMNVEVHTCMYFTYISNFLCVNRGILLR